LKLALVLAGCAMVSMVCQAAGREGVVRLNRRAGVAGEAIRLSDLLPADAPADLRTAAAVLELGKCPQLGSTRVLTGAQITQSLQSRPDVLARLLVPERVTVVRQAWAVKPLPVQRAIADFAERQHWNLRVGGLGEIEIAGNPQALTDNPALLVQNVLPDGVRHRLQFVVRCSSEQICGSFLASTEMPMNLAVAPRAKRNSSRPGETLARAGQFALLSLDDGNLHISLRVVCLEPGLLGQTIRVRDATSRRIFHAEVVAAGALRASL
jgi:hypothetical protein